MTPEDALRLRTLLVDSIMNAMDAIGLVEDVSKEMDPVDVQAAIATAMVRHADALRVTH